MFVRLWNSIDWRSRHIHSATDFSNRPSQIVDRSRIGPADDFSSPIFCLYPHDLHVDACIVVLSLFGNSEGSWDLDVVFELNGQSFIEFLLDWVGWFVDSFELLRVASLIGLLFAKRKESPYKSYPSKLLPLQQGFLKLPFLGELAGEFSDHLDNLVLRVADDIFVDVNIQGFLLIALFRILRNWTVAYFCENLIELIFKDGE